jgi:uncharacterized cupin superfamily protein
MIRARVDIEPDSPAIRHLHPGEEIIYVLEGSLENQIDGQPTKVCREGRSCTPGRQLGMVGHSAIRSRPSGMCNRSEARPK